MNFAAGLLPREKSQRRPNKTLSESFLLHILPMPRLVKVWTKTETFSVAHEPLIDGRFNLDGAIGISGVNRIAAHIEIQRPPRRVRAINRQPRAAGVGRLPPQFVLVFPRAKSRNDLEVFLSRCQFALRRMSEIERWVRDGRGHHLFVCGIGAALDPAQVGYPLGVEEIRCRCCHQLIRLGVGAIFEAIALPSRHESPERVFVEYSTWTQSLVLLPNCERGGEISWSGVALSIQNPANQ